MAVAASGVLDPAALARLVVARARDLLGVDGAGLYVWDADASVARWLAHTAQGESGIGPTLRAGQGAAGLSLQRREPVVVEDYPVWEHAQPDALMLGVRTVAAVPLLADDRAVGVLTVRTSEPRHYSPDEVQLLKLFAAQIAPELEAARLYAESQRRRGEAEALAELARQGAAEPNLEHVIGIVTQSARQPLAADGGRTYHGMAGNRSSTWRTAPSFSRRGPASRAMSVGRTVVLGSSGEPTDYLVDALAIARAEGARTLLGTPLLDQGRPVGALVLRWRTEVAVTADRARLAEALAGYAATVVANARARAELAAQATALRALADERTAIIEPIPSGVSVVDAAGEVVLRNEAARRIRGEVPDAGRTLAQEFDAYNFREPGTGRPLTYAETPVARALPGEAVHRVETTFRRRARARSAGRRRRPHRCGITQARSPAR